jgi:hypothetical protein
MASQSYWAFLSYSSKDAEFVKKLHAKLETYRMPRDLVGRRGRDEPIPKKLFPVFRDRDELPLASDLGATIQDALQASRYLIVICSPNSARSQWVNEEIRYFKQIGRANRILALIVDGEPNVSSRPDCGQEECFPQALRFHVDTDGTITNEPTEPIAGDLRPGKDGWDLAFLKCIAGITGCGLNALTAREKKRARRRKLTIAAAALLLTSGVLGWWDYTRVKIHYYAEIAERFGVPEGYYELSKEQVAHRAQSYKVESSRRKVRSITSVHSSGTPEEKGDFDSAIQELKFDEDGQLQEIVYRNPYQRITARRIFSALKENSRIIEFKSEHDDSPMALSARDVSVAAGASEAARTEVTAQRATYDKTGALIELRYLSSWREPRADPDGVFGKRFEYQDSLLCRKIINLDAFGKPVKNRRGFAVARFQRTAMGHVLEAALFDEKELPVMEPDLYHSYRFDYDNHGNRIAKRFFDEAKHPIETSTGYHQMRMDRSGAGDIVNTTYFDRNLMPVLSSDGYHEMRQSYDAQGHIIRESYHDIRQQAAVNEKQSHEIRFAYDAACMPTMQDYFDIHGAPCLGGEYGVHRESFENTGDGLLRSLSYFDTKLQPMVPPGHVAHRIEFEYDAMGRMAQWQNFDARGLPIPGAEDESMVRLRYDHRGNLIEYANFDASGQPFNVYGYQKITHEYDERGLKVQTAFWAADGRAADGIRGIHSMRYIYDQRGHKSVEEFFGMDEKPTTDLLGVHRYQYRVDDRGNTLEEQHFDENKQSKPGDDGVHIRRFVYNDAGKPTRTEFFDQEGKPMASTNGFQAFTTTYDARGNSRETAYFGIDGAPVRHRQERSHAIIHGYDERNRVNSVKYLDEKRQPIAGAEGWHERHCEFDLRGNTIATRYFGADEMPMVSSDGVHLLRARYDDKDRVLEKTCYGLEEHPVLCEAGWHRMTVERGTEVDSETTRFFGVNGQAILHPLKDWHAEKVIYQKNRANKDVSYFGVKDEPITNDDGIHRFVYEISQGKETACNYFDAKGQPLYVGNYCRWEKVYNEAGEMTEIAWFDEDGEPATNAYGIYRQGKRALANTRITEYANYDSNSLPMRDKGRIHRWQQTCDEEGRIIQIRYLDVDGHPAKEINGIHQVNNTYDARGNIVRKEFFHANGKPALSREGYAASVAEFDAHDRQISQTWLGEDGKPLALPDGIARWTARYDANGYCIERRFFDASQQPTMGSGGHHIQRSQFDDAGHELERAYFGRDGEAVGIENGLHRWVAKYNKRGQLLEKALFDPRQQPVIHPEGHHRFVRTYDDRGNQIRTENFGTAGEPVLWEKQYHRVEYTYDDKDRETSESYFGVNQEPVLCDDGYHKMEQTYDENGRVASVVLSDQDGKQPAKTRFRKVVFRYYLALPMVEKKSYFDSDDKLLFEQKFDMRGEPMDP